MADAKPAEQAKPEPDTVRLAVPWPHHSLTVPDAFGVGKPLVITQEFTDVPKRLEERARSAALTAAMFLRTGK